MKSVIKEKQRRFNVVKEVGKKIYNWKDELQLYRVK